jgi:hypothetical protein
MSRRSQNPFVLRARVKNQPKTRRPLRLEPLEPRLVMYALAGGRWNNPNVSVSFLPDGTSSEGYISTLFAELDAIAPRAVWQREFARALQSWANVSALNFHFVSDNGSPTGTSGSAQGDSRFGDIRLGAHPLTNNYVGYAYYPSSTTKGGDIFLSPDWTFQIDAYLDLYSTLLHEVGHAIGLAHGPAGSIMYPTIMAVYTGLAADDIAGVQAIYGARQNDSYDASAANDSSDTATQITLTNGGANFSADLTTMADIDFYRVVAPTGDGTLTVLVDARNKSLLASRLLVYDAAGNLIGSADVGSAFGTVATVQLSGLIAGQTYTIVADGAAADELGMGAYQLVVQFGGVSQTPPPPPPPPPPTGPTADPYESNNTWTAARNLGKFNSNSQTGLSIHTTTDVDYYSFQVSKSGTFRISTQFVNANGNLDLVVFNAQQQVLATAATTSDLESVTLSLSAGQTYFIKVSSPVSAINTYSLSVAKLSGGRGRGGGQAFDVGHGTPAIGGEHDYHQDDEAWDGDLDRLASDLVRAFHAARGMSLGGNAVASKSIVLCPSSIARVLDDVTLGLDRLAAHLAECRLAANQKAINGHFDPHLDAANADDPWLHGLVVLP